MEHRLRLNHGWILIIITISLVILTCLQAQRSILTRNFQLVNQSRDYSIFLLRALSEIASLSLSATISAAMERIRWTLICRDGQSSRARFVDFLALQEDTTILGLLSLATGAAVLSVKTRLWSIARLIFMIAIPVTGILIMSMRVSQNFWDHSSREKEKKKFLFVFCFDASNNHAQRLISEQAESISNWHSHQRRLRRHISAIEWSR